MTTAFKRARLIAVVSTLIVAAACGSNEGSMDESMKRDLASVAGNSVELAPRAQSSQLVISPVEAAQASAPATVSRKAAPKALSRTPSRVESAPARAVRAGADGWATHCCFSCSRGRASAVASSESASDAASIGNVQDRGRGLSADAVDQTIA